MESPKDIDIVSFRAIVKFVGALGSMFEEKHRPLKLYNKLIHRTQIGHDKPIAKHLSRFKDFCIKNREAIIEQDAEKIVEGKIIYTPNKIFINIPLMFKRADSDSQKTIWQHLLYISSRLDPVSKANEILKDYMKSDSENTLGNLIEKIGESAGDISESSNPMEMVSQMMESGALNDIMGSLQQDVSTGKIDISKLLGSVVSMVGSLEEESKGNPEMEQMMPMLNMLTSMIPKTEPIIQEIEEQKQ